MGWCLATTPWRVINFRLAAELPRKPPSTFRCCRLIANHQSSAPSKACQKSGSFPPPALPGLIGRTTLSDSRPARRARHGVGGATSGRNGPPPITRTTFPTCRAQYPGESERVPMSVASPFHAAFPVSQAGRHPRFHFRGLLRLHSRYGPLDRSTAQGGLCHEASRRPVTQPPRSSATRSTDNSLDGTFPPLVIRAFGAHWEMRVNVWVRRRGGCCAIDPRTGIRTNLTFGRYPAQQDILVSLAMTGAP